jgi:hypothetical protein
MEKAKLLALIAALYLLDIKERAALIKETAKENGIAEGDLFKLLKETGYNPKAEKGTAAPTGAQTPPPQRDGETQNAGTGATDANLAQTGANGTPPQTVTVTLRHKTEYPHYRRAGLVLKQTPGEFRVTAEQLAALEKDKWVAIVKGGGEQ